MADYTGDLRYLPFQPFQEVKCLISLHKEFKFSERARKGLKEMCSGGLDVDVNVQKMNINAFSAHERGRRRAVFARRGRRRAFNRHVDVDVRFIDTWTWTCYWAHVDVDMAVFTTET